MKQRRIPRRRYEVTSDALAVLGTGDWREPGTDWRSGLVRRAAMALDVPTDSSVWLTGSGRAALVWVLARLGVAAPARILVPSWTFAGVAATLQAAGFEPVYADCSRQKPVWSLTEVQKAWRDGTKAVLLTHLFGRMDAPADIVAWCRSRGAVVVEDCAHSPGSRWSGQAAGTFGDAAFFSFDTLKPASALGGGLAVVHDHQGNRESLVTDSGPPSFARRLTQALAEVAAFRFAGPQVDAVGAVAAKVRIRQQPSIAVLKKPPGQSFSYLQCRLLNRQLATLARRIEARQAMAARLLDALEIQPSSQPDEQPNAYFLVVRAADGQRRDDIRSDLRAAGIDTGFGNQLADVLDPSASATSSWHQTAIQLPCGALYTDDEIGRMSRVLGAFAGRLVY